jgi:predicted DNA-binding transcriptional regulator YafY
LLLMLLHGERFMSFSRTTDEADPNDPKTWKVSLRLIEMERLLRAKPRKTSELAEYFGWSQRQTQRHIKHNLSKWQIEHDPDSDSYWIVAPPRAQLNEVQALAAHAAVRMLYHHTPGYNAHYIETLNFLAQYLPPFAREIAQQTTTHLRQRADDLQRAHDEGRTLEIVAQAWFQRRVLAFDYVSPGGSGALRHKELQVYFIEVSKANLALYAIGYERSWHKEVLTFKLARMQNVMLRSETFAEVPSDFSPQDFLANARGVIGDHQPIDVQLKFDGGLRSWFEENHFPGVIEQTTDLDGSLVFTIRTGTNKKGEPQELIPWIRGFGAKVEVLGPPAVRAAWLAEAEAITKRFGGG